MNKTWGDMEVHVYKTGTPGALHIVPFVLSRIAITA